MKSIVADYLKIISQASVFSQGWLRSVNDWHTATTMRSSRGIDDDKLRAFAEIYSIDLSKLGVENTNKGSIKCIQSLTLEAKPSVYDISPSGRYTVAFFNSEKPYLEVGCNDEDGLRNSRLDTTSLHGKFIADSWFGGLSWSTDERFLAYVALKKDVEKSTYFASESKEGTSSSSKSSRYDYNEDWGEKYDGVAELSLHVLDVLHMRVCTVSDIDSTKWTVGQPCFLRRSTTEDDDSSNNMDVLVYTAWNTRPRKLGMIYCYQRPCSLFATDLTYLLREQSETQGSDITLSHRLLTKSTATARSARSNADGSSLVFLGSEKGFQTHNGCSELFRISGADIRALFQQSTTVEKEQHTDEVADNLVEKIVAEVRNPLLTEAEFSFPGIFTDQLPKQCFLSDNNSVVLSTMWGSSETIVVVNLTSKTVERITELLPIASSSSSTETQPLDTNHSGSSSSSSSILDVSGDNILLVTSSPTTPQQLCVYNCTEKRIIAQNSKPSKFFATKIKQSPPSTSTTPFGEENSIKQESRNIADLQSRIFHHQADGIPYDSILVFPTDKKPSISLSGKSSFLPISRKKSLLTTTGVGVVKETHVFGVGVDQRSESRCDHWHSELDIVAIKFPCCGKFYACRSYHDECEDHEAVVWPRSKFDESGAVLCGSCGEEMSVNAYLSCDNHCPSCGASFNPGCKLHRDLYFAGDSADDSSSTSTTGRRLLPIVVVPHGGPHSVTPTSFIASSAFLSINLDAAILNVNYRGSTGFGQDSIESLPGQIGRNDVDDIVSALHAVVEKFNNEGGDETTPLLDLNRVSVVGGSHGGFLASHLIGQHPDIFKVACMRNPVTNIPSMCGGYSSIDWCFVESLGSDTSSYDFGSTVYSIPTEDQLIAMRKRSPVQYIDQVRAPTLLCLGAKDRRVPYSQGIEYYHLLKSRSVKTRLLIYPEDVHAIDRPATEAEQWVAIAEWIKEHL